MTGTGIGHRVIAASAGSGKTFQLANRYIAMLAGGADPARIVALTFSRKAAGEILDKILSRLADAAETEARAGQLAESLSEAGYTAAARGLDRARVCALLRRLLEHLHLARVGTLDSFFVSILRAFPFEFGLGGTFDIMGEHETAVAVRTTLGRVLVGAAGPEERKALLEQFKQATFGQESKSFAEALKRFVGEHHGLLLDAPDVTVWGAPDRIWPNGSPGPILSVDERRQAADELGTEVAALELSPKQRSRFDAFIGAAAGFSLESPLDSSIEYMLGKVLPALAEMERHGLSVTMDSRKPLELPVSTARPLARLARHVVACAVAVQVVRTQGIAALLGAYEAVYAATVRSAGKLTFQDVQFLLGQGERGAGPLLSGEGGPDRLYIDYRLDGTFDHWLLDEFQDTSTVQWLALRNLADEVLQRRDGSKTLFYVGDTKQAIYGWRGGDYELFHRVLDAYNAAGDAVLEVTQLATSWRSSPTVIDAVNRVFGHLDQAGVSSAVRSLWSASWQEHRAEKRDLSGCVRLLRIDRPKGRGTSSSAAKWEVLVHQLREIAPWERGLSSAVLVRSNGVGQEIIAHLRSQGIPATWEGDFAITDSPAVRTFLSLLRCAYHPADTFAARHVQMSPAAPLLAAEGGGRAPSLLETLDDIVSRGFEHAVLRYREQMDGAGLLTDFERLRLDQLAVAAAAYDRTGERAVLPFVDFILAYRLGEAGPEHTVRVMTNHKSKGLEFDVVILPDLEGSQSIELADVSGIGLSKAESVTREVEWALLMPRKLFVQADPALNRFYEKAAADSCYEELCLLYVAMTRARRGLYLVTTADAEKSESLYLSTVLHRTLAGGTEPVPLTLDEGTGAMVFESGVPAWYEECHASPGSESPAGTEVAKPAAPAIRSRFQRRTPSGEEERLVSAGSLFAPSSLSAAELGTAVHTLFEEVGWLPGVDAAAAEAAAGGRLSVSDAVWQEASQQFHTSLEAEAVQAALARPGDDAELWRERTFEALVEEHWVSGCFDRVQIERDSRGRAVAATILDYKTSRLDREGALERAVAHYRPQMQLYRTVLSRLLELDETDIDLKLVFTRTGEVITL